MTTADKNWKSFEDVFREILGRHKEFFGLEDVEPGPAKVAGRARRVRPWDIEVVGYRKEDRRLVIFECRRRGRNVEPGHAAEFAYRIDDTGAETGFFVTTLENGLSQGAQEVADYERIGHIRLSREATPDEYVMRCMDNIFVGLAETLTFSDEAVSVVSRHGDGITGQRTVETEPEQQ